MQHRRIIGICRSAASLPVLFALVLVPLGGCQEFVHMGQVSDGVSSWSVGDAKIEQKQDDGTWKALGSTDGNGRWWILKEDIRGGGPIRISKPGYRTKMLSEADFLNNPNILMIPDESEGGGAGWSTSLRLRFDLRVD